MVPFYSYIDVPIIKYKPYSNVECKVDLSTGKFFWSDNEYIDISNGKWSYSEGEYIDIDNGKWSSSWNDITIERLGGISEISDDDEYNISQDLCYISIQTNNIVLGKEKRFGKSTETGNDWITNSPLSTFTLSDGKLSVKSNMLSSSSLDETFFNLSTGDYCWRNKKGNDYICITTWNDATDEIFYDLYQNNEEKDEEKGRTIVNPFYYESGSTSSAYRIKNNTSLLTLYNDNIKIEGNKVYINSAGELHIPALGKVYYDESSTLGGKFQSLEARRVNFIEGSGYKSTEYSDLLVLNETKGIIGTIGTITEITVTITPKIYEENDKNTKYMGIRINDDVYLNFIIDSKEGAIIDKYQHTIIKSIIPEKLCPPVNRCVEALFNIDGNSAITITDQWKRLDYINGYKWGDHPFIEGSSYRESFYNPYFKSDSDDLIKLANWSETSENDDNYHRGLVWICKNGDIVVTPVDYFIYKPPIFQISICTQYKIHEWDITPIQKPYKDDESFIEGVLFLTSNT